MNKLTKTQLNQLEALRAEAEVKISELNDITQQINELCEGFADVAQSFFDDKTEKWQDGETGQAYSEWIEALRVEVDELSDSDVLGALADYPASPGE